MPYKQQGDVLFNRAKKLPLKLSPITPGHYGIVLAEGETTNHRHVIVDDIQAFKDSTGTIWIKTEKTVKVTHEEHNPVTLEPGIYEVGRVREYDPFMEEARRVVD